MAEDEGTLSQRASTIYVTDDTLLETLTEDQAPYDHSTNIILIPPPPPPVKPKKGKDPEFGWEPTYRRSDDADLHLCRYLSRSARMQGRPRSPDLEFLDDYDEEGDVEKIDVSQGFLKYLRPGDVDLSFLDSF
ncbi:hypothetical protein CC86DRAFT_465094 [Ophiobolus disseminans]|uniref:Uncharacterized protein n=1 Tax=Ophiobolus disseminans TaxID=1469910 RepID=A0A6A7A883_9PLEO|nr:hypothetical protein CC86DRAFT_465094 [Ophiobolus disseminans]